MESSAIFVGFLLLAMLLICLAAVVLSILVNLNKLPRVVGYVSLGVQAALTVFAFTLTQQLGFISLSIFAVCLILVFVGRKQKITK